MDVDLWQLPIPNWDLLCPSCRYPLRGLPAHRCPECGLSLDMDAIVQSWTRLREPRISTDVSPLPDLGLFCLKCESSLDGATDKKCPNCKRRDARLKPPDGDWFRVTPWIIGGAPITVIVDLLAASLVPYVSQSDSGFSNSITGGMQSFFVEADSAFYYEVIWLARNLRKNASAPDKENEWGCEQCGESNPASFDICWQCSTQQAS